MNISGKCTIYAKEFNGKVLYSTKISQKNINGEWESMFINVQFPKNTSISDKTKIEVTKGFEGFYKDKNGLPHITQITTEIITTREQAEQYKITFGKHAGKTIKELVETEKDYCNWLYNNEKTDPIIKKCLNLMIEK